MPSNSTPIVRIRKKVAANSRVSAISEEGKEEPEPPKIVPTYFLLDAETGKVSPAKGEFEPLTQHKARPLQPTANQDEFWVALPNVWKKETQIGIYNMKTFTFKVWRVIPQLVFESRDLLADEKGGKFYFIYKGHLLAVPLAL